MSCTIIEQLLRPTLFAISGGVSAPAVRRLFQTTRNEKFSARLDQRSVVTQTTTNTTCHHGFTGTGFIVVRSTVFFIICICRMTWKQGYTSRANCFRNDAATQTSKAVSPCKLSTIGGNSIVINTSDYPAEDPGSTPAKVAKICRETLSKFLIRYCLIFDLTFTWTTAIWTQIHSDCHGAKVQSNITACDTLNIWTFTFTFF